MVSPEIAWVAGSAAALAAWLLYCWRLYSQPIQRHEIAALDARAIDENAARFRALIDEYYRDAARWPAGTTAGTDTKVE